MLKKSTIPEPSIVVPVEIIQTKIYLIRGRKVMLDRDLAELYEVPTKSLNLAVKRNLTRFPEDFMLQLTEKEVSFLRFQIETSNVGRGGRRYLPYVFTEQGVAMLSSVLRSEKAVQVNIQIMRTFAKLREMMLSHKSLARRIENLERKYKEQDKKFAGVFDAIKRLLYYKEEENKKRGPVGFVISK